MGPKTDQLSPEGVFEGKRYKEINRQIFEKKKKGGKGSHKMRSRRNVVGEGKHQNLFLLQVV